MTDLTPLFDTILRSHSAHLIRRSFSVDNLDEFLREAYTINHAIKSLHTDLLSIRQSYLSTAQPRRTLIKSAQHERAFTDREREEIDAKSKTMLRDLNAKIRQMTDTEKVRRETETAVLRKKYSRGLGVLGSWAAGGSGPSSKSAEHAAAEERANSVTTHRESVLWMLNQRLGECLKSQQDMMQVRIDREVEKSRSVLARAGAGESAMLAGMGGAGSPVRKRRRSTATKSNGLPPEEKQGHDPAEELSPEQIQMFEQENHDMLQHYESVLDQVRTAEKSLIEISELQTQLVSNLATQSAHIDQLVAESFNTTENVGGGNKQLKQATKRPSTAKYTFYATCGLCTVLIVWDLLI
ncbi:hypothetical protein BJ170DRAFT_591834 [Xylariales sp. AK1849]|nr:hypothetical protein BJ170DRAFT_591834 [Xylariales sp. AK1849]